MARDYHLRQEGIEVQAALDKIIGLGPATHVTAGTMTAQDKIKLDSLGIQYNTTAYWNSRVGYMPAPGEIIIYSDYDTVEINGETIQIPGIKIGTGNGYVQDIRFITDGAASNLLNHINNTMIHTNAAEKAFWNNKLNVNDMREVVDEELIFNRN